MIILPIAAITTALFGLLLAVMAIFLILLVLVQRGRGGGLAGALGGMGGSSAFGAKAGDVFTRITIGAATIWILLCIACARWGSSSTSRLDVQGGSQQTTDETVSSPPADKDKDKAQATPSAPAAATTAPSSTGAATEGKGPERGGQPAETGTTDAPPAPQPAGK